MSQRPDRLTLTLGKHEAEERKEALQALADELTSGNISAMIQKIADGELEVSKMRSFTAWQVKTKGFKKLFSGIPEETPVWRGGDGSYIVAQDYEFGPEHEDDAEYIQSGTVGDYIE